MVVRDRDVFTASPWSVKVGERTPVVMPLDPSPAKRARSLRRRACWTDHLPVLILDVGGNPAFGRRKLLRSSGRLDRLQLWQVGGAASAGPGGQFIPRSHGA